MANIYVRSGAGGTGTGADWTNAYTTIKAAWENAGTVAGDIFWISEDHGETQASALTATCKGTSAAPSFCYCVNHLGTVPPVSADLRTTATITTTGNSAINIFGTFYMYGVTISCGSGANALDFNLLNTDDIQTYESCVIKVGGTSGGNILFSSAGTRGRAYIFNTTFGFASTNSVLRVNSTHFTWKNTATAITGTVPNNLFVTSSPPTCWFIEGVDLSTITTNLVSSGGSIITLKDCKLNGSATIVPGVITVPSQSVNVIRCASGATNYIQEKHEFCGDLTTETTIVRTGGATDGTTPISWKIITTNRSRWTDPFIAFPIAKWNDIITPSTVTATIYGIWGSGAVPNNDDIWIDAEYPGSTLTPQGSFTTLTKADNLASGSALTADGSTWGGSTTAFKMAVTFTPQMKGPITIYVKAAKASTTFYIDPLVVFS